MLAHETWFTDARPGFTVDLLTDPWTAASVIGVVVVAAIWRVARQWFPQPALPWLSTLRQLSPYIPRLLGIHAGVSLLSQASRGTYLAPALDLPDGWFGALLAVLEGLVGLWLVTGWRIRPAAWLLVLAGPLGMIGYGVIPILERIDLLGIALFLAILPPGDDPGGAVNADLRTLRQALFGLRLLVGGALVVLAFSEKFLRPDLALAFLDRYPAFNLLQTMGLEVSDLAFVRIAGATELLFGLLIISGALPQIAVLVAGIPFNATLFFLGVPELIGHLPVYGAMLALLVYGSDPRIAPLVPWFPGERKPEGGLPHATARSV